VRRCASFKRPEWESCWYVYVMSKGRVVYESTPAQLRADEAAMRAHLGVAA
jgi:ABC-type branched-subunit amino acid transport system ATPase component